MDSIPIVAITCNVGVSLLGKDSFQEIDIAGITTPITKYSFIVKDVTKLADTIRRAFSIARKGRPGPVLVDITKDVTANKVDYVKQEPVFTQPDCSAFTEEDLDKAIHMIEKAKKPYIFVGGGAILSGASETLKAFVEKSYENGVDIFRIFDALNDLRNLKSAVDADDRFEATRELAKAYFLIHDTKKAEYYAREAIKHFADENDCSKEDYMSYKPYSPVRIGIWAWIELCLGNKEKALAMFEDMDNHLRCEPCRYKKCFEKTLYLADVYAALGELDKAKQLYEETLEINPGCLEAKLKLERINNPVENKKKKFLKFLPF